MTVSLTKTFWDHISKNRVVEKMMSSLRALQKSMNPRESDLYGASQIFQISVKRTIRFHLLKLASFHQKEKIITEEPCRAFNMFTFITVYFILLSGPFSRLHKLSDRFFQEVLYSKIMKSIKQHSALVSKDFFLIC